MTISVISLTGNLIGEIKKAQYSERHTSNWLPPYCLRKDNNTIDSTENYLQFIESGDDVYFLFDVDNTEQPLAEEFNEFDFDFLHGDYSIIKTLPSVRKIEKVMDLWSYGLSDHLVFEVEYSSYYDDYSGGTEHDVHIGLVGYLDQDKKLIYLENQNGK